LLFQLIIGTIHKDIPITNEIMARTAPNVLDLMVVLAGGAAVAYATVSLRLSVAFIGVAMATALVPPLAVAGILFARGRSSFSVWCPFADVYQSGSNPVCLLRCSMVYRLPTH
jgi:uncharacterized membrane protein